MNQFGVWVNAKLRALNNKEITEVEELKRTLKDLDLETCTAKELGAFFSDKTFKEDVVVLLRTYLEISASQISLKRDQVVDEMVHQFTTFIIFSSVNRNAFMLLQSSHILTCAHTLQQAHCQLEKKNTAFHQTVLQEIDAKVKAVNSVHRMLFVDPW